MVHAAWVPELPPDPAFWMQGIEGSVRTTRMDGGRRHRVEFEVGGRGDLRPWIARLAGEPLAPYVEMMEYEGEVSWTLAGSGTLAATGPGGEVRWLQVEGHLAVDYRLAWSYGWDTPRIEQLHGKRHEAWSGTLVLEGTCLD
jgi:hypothetical protein